MDILDKYVRRGKRTASRIYGSITIVLIMPLILHDIRKDVFELSSDGTFIWKLLENKPKLRKIVDCFAKKKRIKRDIAAKDVVKFIKELAAKKMVDILDSSEQV
ncbi:MAG: PqqD family protein [Candidatus Omnitrophota bacterium]